MALISVSLTKIENERANSHTFIGLPSALIGAHFIPKIICKYTEISTSAEPKLTFDVRVGDPIAIISISEIPSGYELVVRLRLAHLIQEIAEFRRE